MASKMWLLVEWLHQSDMFPSYGVVNVKTADYDPSDLRPGSDIIIKLKKNKPQQASIMRISENKQYVEDHKELLERQNIQFKTMVKLCMRGIRQMRAENDPFNSTRNDAHHSRDRRSRPQLVVASQTDSASDDESESNNYKRKRNKSLPNSSLQLNKPAKKNTKVNRCIPWVTSTPLLTRGGQNLILHYHQETQTEDIFFEVNTEQATHMMDSLNKLYTEFMGVCAAANLDCETIWDYCDTSDETSSDYDHYEYDYLTEPSTSSALSQRNSSVCDEDDGRNVRDSEEDSDSDKPLKELKLRKRNIPRTPKVHKIAKQSHNNNISNSFSMSHDKDMAPIGNGYAKVPVRLLDDMDWSSYTTATRNLLQAIFPRSVLATHCLTGKQSPAFMNRPPKKILDPKLVEDIVKIVSTRCNVPKNLVRNTITIKCTDEAKLYRNRQQYKLQRRANMVNDENRPPPTADDVINLQ